MVELLSTQRTYSVSDGDCLLFAFIIIKLIQMPTTLILLILNNGSDYHSLARFQGLPCHILRNLVSDVEIEGPHQGVNHSRCYGTSSTEGYSKYPLLAGCCNFESLLYLVSAVSALPCLSWKRF